MIPYAQKLQDPRWQRKRLEILLRDEWECQDCFDKSKQLQVHHAHYQKGPPWETESRFLITLCVDCHQARKDFEKRAYEALGAILASRHPDSIADFVESLERVPIGKWFHNPVAVDSNDVHEASIKRWYRHALEHPDARWTFETVTGQEVDWQAAETAEAELKAQIARGEIPF